MKTFALWHLWPVLINLLLSDVVTIDKTGEFFRLIYDVKGRFTVHRITADEAKVSRLNSPSFRLYRSSVIAELNQDESSQYRAKSKLINTVTVWFRFIELIANSVTFSMRTFKPTYALESNISLPFAVQVVQGEECPDRTEEDSILDHPWRSHHPLPRSIDPPQWHHSNRHCIGKDQRSHSFRIG